MDDLSQFSLLLPHDACDTPPIGSDEDMNMTMTTSNPTELDTQSTEVTIKYLSFSITKTYR